MIVEAIDRGGARCAEIIRTDAPAGDATLSSPANSSLEVNVSIRA
jgi:hypothetical protein